MEQSVKLLQEQLGLQYTFAQVPLCLCELISGLDAYSSLCLSSCCPRLSAFSLCPFHSKSERLVYVSMSGYNLLVLLLTENFMSVLYSTRQSYGVGEIERDVMERDIANIKKVCAL